MAKHKPHQVLFDVLRREPAAAPGGAARPGPAVRRTPSAPAAQPAAAAHPAPAARTPEKPRPEAAARSARPFSAAPPAPFLLRQVSVPFSHLLLGALTAACLIAIAFAVGTRYGPERLPATEKHPTFAEIQGKGATPGLVAPGPSQPVPGKVGVERPSAPPAGPPSPAAPGRPAPGSPAETPRPAGAGRPALTETPAPGAPHYRVRIARLAVSQPEAIDKMRAFLSQKGVETELDTRSGYYVLYSRDRFADKRKSDDLAAEINRQLGEFEKSTRIPTSKDAYSILVTKE
ncbi:MAG: hypothetical protein FJ288_03505 [Planctomycetes bacterium]|nr:hypothetical protein [Planctomycetota bacterium]